MPSRDHPSSGADPPGRQVEKHLRWRVVVGDRPGLRRRRWPVALAGSRLTEVPGRNDRPADSWNALFVARIAVAAQSPTWLRHLLDHPVSLAKVRRVSVVVDSWRIPQRGWSGRLGPLPHLLAHRARLPRYDRGRAVVDVELRWSVPLRCVVAAVLPLFTPVRPMPAPASADVTAQDVFPEWLGAGPTLAAVAGELPESADIRPHDLVLTRTGEPRPPRAGPAGGDPAGGVGRPGGSGAGGADPPGAGRDGVAGSRPYRAVLAADPIGAGAGPGPDLVLVDLEHAGVAGRYGPFGPGVPRAELSFGAGPDGRGWQIADPDGIVVAGHLDRPWLTEPARAALAGVALVGCRSVPGRYPPAEAAVLVHLVLAGPLVHVPELPRACRGQLADEVADLLTGALPDRPAGDLEWEVRAVRQRRAAMRRHARGLVLPRLAGGAFPALAGPPPVTALLVTRRLEHVADAVAAIEAQTYPELEIVLCLHGVDLPAGLRSRLAGCARPLEILPVPAGHSFGEAIGQATARARGSLVTKFDDDDTYGPEHVWDLVLARHHSGATMVGKAAEFVYLETLDTTVRRESGAPESFTSLIAGGTMLISRGDLEQVGGWRPVPRSVDRGLIDRVRRAGGLIYRTHPLGYVYQRRSAGHTWDPGLEYFLRGGGTQWSGLPRHSEFGTLPPGGTPVAGAGGAGRPGSGPGVPGRRAAGRR